MKPKQIAGRAGPFLLLLLVLLSACSPTAPTPTVTPPPSATPTTPVRTVTPLPVPTPTLTPTPSIADAIFVGLLQSREPDTLWLLGNATEEQRLVQAAIVEPPMTTLDYDYQAVLFQRIPTLENGDAVITRTSIPIDPATGEFTVTETGVYTTVDQLQMVFRMRDKINWSDGQPVKASDSVFGYSVACSPESGYADFARCEKVERYEALDDRTIRVFFKPGVMELDYFTYYWDFMPEHAWSSYTPEEMATTERTARRLSPSYGPYMVEDWTPGESITLARNPYYTFYGPGYPVVDKIIFKFLPDSYSLLSQLLAGQIDLVERHGLEGLDTQLLLSLEENGLLRLYSHPALLWENIVINLNDPNDLAQPHPILADPAFRQALAYGINRETMGQAAYPAPAVLMHSWIPSIHWAYAGADVLTLYDYDPQRASELLEEAGWILADDGYRYKDGSRLELQIFILAGQPLRETIVQQFQGAVEPLGMVIEVVRVREEDWYGEESPLSHRAFDLIEFAWIAGMEPNGQVSYTCGEIPTEENGWRGQNYGGWCNAIATTALLGATKELRRERRADLYRMAQEEFTTELPALPLFSRLYFYAAAPGLVNLKLNPTEYMTWNCWQWSLPAQRR